MSHMSRIVVLLLIGSLVAPQPGAGQVLGPVSRYARAAAAQEPTQLWKAIAREIPVGSAIKIRTRSAGRFKAVLLGMEETHLMLQARTRIVEAPRAVAFADIESLELDKAGMGVGKAIAIGAAVGAGATIGTLMVIFALLND